MSDAGQVHVIGAGLAGLAAGVALAGEGRRVTLYESGQHAGGRCRSFFDSELGCRIDNGNHLLLAGNTGAMSYVDRIGSRATFEEGEAVIPFVDLTTGERWSLRPNQGRLPWWLFSGGRRVPGTRPRDYLAAARLRHASDTASVADLLAPTTVLFRRLWEPLAVAALNTSAQAGSARLFWRILVETLGRGGAACRPMIPREGLSESLVDPALSFLRQNGAEIRVGARLRALSFAGERVGDLLFESGGVELGAADEVILAVPSPIAARLVPNLTVPDDHAPIVNAHFRATAPAGTPSFIGVVGGTAEWVFRKSEVLSVTVSAADALIDDTAEALRVRLWEDVARVCRLPASPVPPARIVKERRATFRATPAQLKRRPAATTAWNNLRLSGDYVDTGLPATIEGAIRSGFAAAALINRQASPSTPMAGVANARPHQRERVEPTSQDNQRAQR